jgi:hypothetical protein
MGIPILTCCNVANELELLLHEMRLPYAPICVPDLPIVDIVCCLRLDDALHSECDMSRHRMVLLQSINSRRY